MSKRIFFFYPFPHIIFIFFIFFTCCKSQRTTSTFTNSSCPPSVCGNVKDISYPFRLKGDPNHCGDKNFELDCDQNNHTIITFKNSKKFYVQSITYYNFTIRVVDPGLTNPTSNCSFPINPSILYDDIPSLTYNNFLEYNLPVVFISCNDPISNNSARYVDISFCNNKARNGTGVSDFSRDYGYVGVLDDTVLSDLPESCGIEKVTAMSANVQPLMGNGESSLLEMIHEGLAYGFELSWYRVLCSDCLATHGFCSLENNTVTCKHYCPEDVPISQLGFRCQFEHYAPIVIAISILVIGGLLVLRFLIGIGCLTALIIHKWRRRHLSADESIEDFLQGQTNLLPINYTYRDIKKMTNNFKNKLGEGGYGVVYRGKLRSGPLVAVKMMNKKKKSSISKEEAEEFTNEVSTIGRIHHVNVVQLIGFCNEGSKHALVYEYMPNGSLDKYITISSSNPSSTTTTTTPLTYKNMFDISLGVARGIDYLHTGGDMQILHFDIKPHNILLDSDFHPKISDFGLAQLYPTGLNTITLPTTTRGTMGYMAPELFYKNIGGVSYKADVYSFGMLLIELASRKENIHPFDESVGQIYFPSWVYDQFYEGKEIEMGDDVSDEERIMVKKMIKVALWCIQMKPGNRPSMNRVVEMLEGGETVAMPPRPFIAPLGSAHQELQNGVSAPPRTQT